VRELENILERAIALCENGVIEARDLGLSGSRANATSADAGTAPSSAPGTGSLDEYIDSLQREVLINALKETKYNKTKAAANLGITFRALRYKLKKLGID
jgi:two-component system, NtrC family, response regulator PilR